MKLIKPLIALSLVFSACSAIEKPNVEICIVNGLADHRKCYNMHDDFEDDGSLKPTAVPKYHGNTAIMDLNKALVVDSPYDEEHPNVTHFEDGQERLKSYIKQLRTEYENCRSGSNSPNK